MDIPERRVRRRGSFIHVETPELDHVEQESTEGVHRLRSGRPRISRAVVSSRKPTHAVRTTAFDESDTPESGLRLASGTELHRQARMPR